MICPYCGEPIADDSKFCSHCGKPLFSVEMDDYDLYAADAADPEVDRRLIAGADEDTHILPAGEVSAEAPSSGKDGDMQAASGSGGTAAPYGKPERDKVPVSVDGDTHPLPAEEAARAVDPDLDLTPYDLDEDGEQPQRRTESASRNERDGRSGESRVRLERYVPKRNARAEEPEDEAEEEEEEDGGGGGHTAFLVVLCAALAAAVFFALYYMVSSGIFSGRTAVRTGSTEVKPITVIANQTTPTPAASDAGGGTATGRTAAPTSAPAVNQPTATPSAARQTPAAPDVTVAPTPEQTQIPEATEAVTPTPTEDPDAVVLTPDEDNEATDDGQEQEQNQDQNNQEDVVG